MDANHGRGWLLALAGLLPIGSNLAQEPSPPALLPPASFAARIAARPLTPVAPDPTVQVERELPAELPTAAEALDQPATASAAQAAVPRAIPSVSAQPDYERAMSSIWEHKITLSGYSIDPTTFEKMLLPAVRRLTLDAAPDAQELGLTPIALSSRPHAGESATGSHCTGRLELSSDLGDGAAVIRLVPDGGR